MVIILEGSEMLEREYPDCESISKSKYKLLKLISVGLDIETLKLTSENLGAFSPEIYLLPSTKIVPESNLTLL